jgi:hypothetical protein
MIYFVKTIEMKDRNDSIYLSMFDKNNKTDKINMPH